MITPKIIAIPYFADPEYSPHLHRQAKTLTNDGYAVWAIGYLHRDQKKHKNSFFTYSDIFYIPPILQRGPLAFFYFAIKTFAILLKRKPDILQPIDVPALIPSSIFAWIFNIPLYYYSFEDLPTATSLVHSPVKRTIWTFLEGMCIKIARNVAVVADIDAHSFQKRYGICKPFVIRNVPMLTPLLKKDSLLLRKKFGWTHNEKVLMYHGIIEKGRGIEHVFPALQHHSSLRLAIAGYGDFTNDLKKKAIVAGVDSQIGWIGPYVHSELNVWLQDADIGILTFEHISQAIFQALPCKLFECIHAGIPVVAADFPEIRAHINASGAGLLVTPGDTSDIEKQIIRLLNDTGLYAQCKESCLKDRSVTNWENEAKIYRSFLGI